MVEVREIVEAAVERDLGDPPIARPKRRRRLAKPRAQQILMRRRPGQPPEGAQELECAQLRIGRECTKLTLGAGVALDLAHRVRDAPQRLAARLGRSANAWLACSNLYRHAATAQLELPRVDDQHLYHGDMMSSSTVATSTSTSLDPALASRIVREGYGPGAWHGPDLSAAVDGVDAKAAFRRPAANRHNIAEVVTHHAFYVRSVIERLGGTSEAFPFEGEDWFTLEDERAMKWSAIVELLDGLQTELAALVAKPSRSGKTAPEQMDLVLGITCHAVYHAGQIQLIKVLAAA